MSIPFPAQPSNSADDLPPQPTPGRWQRRADLSFSSVPFDGSFILFNPRSGQTHLVNELVMDILEALLHHPMDGRELVASLNLEADEKEALPKMERILSELDHLGLIFPVDP
ncbi:MAG: HPr-rel-A system PqqD family peptide chaperone [Magnetococcales bacterium]|nr:HPr-rel-A system PqqD family peptide chaperone [Magnetococcales bacterium]